MSSSLLEGELGPPPPEPAANPACCERRAANHVLRVRDSRTEGLATKGEVNNFLSRLEAALDAAPKRFFKSSGNSGDEDGSRSASDEKKRAKIHASIRALFHRQTLSKREVQLLQGVVSALAPSQRSQE